jgi:ubiquinone/menaquinone biosynthesis C-methylase UbiE
LGTVPCGLQGHRDAFGERAELMMKLFEAMNVLFGRPRRFIPPAMPRFKRSEYKALWNSVSVSEDAAKMAVSGDVDEDHYKRSGQHTVAMLQDCVGIRPDDVVLEIGAGVGRVGAILAPQCRQWIGTDVSENMIKHMTRRLSGLTNVKIIETNGFDLGVIGDASIDVVYCTVVFMHLEQWDRYNYISEGFRVLKPRGRMLVDNVNLVSDEGWKFFEMVRALRPSERPPQISVTSTPQELETYFRRAGYSDIQQKESSLWTITYGIKPPSADAVPQG